MPKIYRVMQKMYEGPTIGNGPLDLGVRVPTDIQPDFAGNVSPGIGGMSVSPRLTALPPHRVPRRLHPLVPRAAGKDFHFVWSMGEGAFAAGTVALGLCLRPDPANDKHGFVEPVAVIAIADYQEALAATRDEWQVDETG